MEYKLVFARDFNKFVSAVNDEIKKGWEPLGGASMNNLHIVQSDTIEEYYAQAMVRRSS